MTEAITLTIVDDVGLHARPAKEFAAAAKQFAAEIEIRNETEDSGWVNAKSLMAILTLAAQHGHEVNIRATGPDAADALAVLRDALVPG